MPELNIVGTLQGASLLPTSSAAAFCRWKLMSGAGWTLLAGDSAGQTQVAQADTSAPEEAGGRCCTWSHPVEAHYSCSVLTEWPQLVLTVWQQDELKRNEIVGYGVIRVPAHPGVHTLEVACWRPAGTWAQELTAWFIGGVPHLPDPSLLTNTGSRHKIATVTTMTISLELQILAKGFEELGVAL